MTNQLGEVDTLGFRKFDHVARSAHREVDGICDGTVYIFPKMDGTNASVWAERVDDGKPIVGGGVWEVVCGSRNRRLKEGDDNHGFRGYVHGDSEIAENLRIYALAHPNLILYGEWLIPNVIKGYVESAWRRFYVFDVYSRSKQAYLPYDVYSPGLKEAGVDFLPAVEMTDPLGPELDELAANNAHLMKPGEFGEGIVVKNYGWRNQFDRQPWMKVLRPGFMNKPKAPARGAGHDATEIEIAEALVDGILVEKEFARGVLRLAESMKIELVAFDDPAIAELMKSTFVEEHRSKVIGILLAQVFQDVVDDQLTTRVLKKLGWPTINFSNLRSAVTRRVKELKPELFS